MDTATTKKGKEMNRELLDEIDKRSPSVSEFRTAAKVCRWTADFLRAGSSWWNFWMLFPIDKLKWIAGNFEGMADREEDKSHE